ncbi:hypothetical protein Tsubulata_007878 [Turnera subulata]|uniref:PHD-type domain-containing protein n=1 Tax=Turnera subulata TaxID=218843 RepID=A0A9Q0J5K8_9ROSI|nr:hypothetical protein Tsubulata_007878 [Turnera subulata]
MVSAKRRGRSVGELYNATEVIGEPEMKSVKGVNNPVQEPVEGSVEDMEKNMQADKRSGKRFTRQKVHTKVESGTCNVCSAPCSSCMHLKLAHMGSKDDEFSDENCRVTASSQYSINEGDFVPSFKNRARESLQHATSETSNPFSVSSSHDSLSEIADSKANIRSSYVSDTSLQSGIPKLSSDGIVPDQQRTLQIKREGSKTEEGHDDNISCVSGANHVSALVSVPSENMERKTSVVNSLGLEGSGKAIFSHKTDLTQASTDADGIGRSPSVQKKTPPSDDNAEHLEEDSSIHDHGEPVDSPVERINLLLSKEMASNIATGNDFIAGPSADAIQNNGIVTGDNFNTSGMISPKTESEHEGIEVQTDKAQKCPSQVGQHEKRNVSVESDDVRDSTSQSLIGDESEGSEEHDVKVCDICGDAGREEELAACSRCSDGAEHIYCMREMLPEVPKSGWLCEECKFAEENESRKHGAEMEEKKTSKATTQSTGKRHAETVEVSSAPKRQAIETCMGSPKPSSPGKIPSLSRDSSFKSLDKGKVKHAHQASPGSQSSVDISETANSSSTGPRLQTPKGSLLKSNSFSTYLSKPKVKPVDEFPQKHKSTKESSSDTKESSGRIMSKSMSFKSVNSGRTVATESKVKMLPSKFSQAHDLKRLKQVKERGVFERKSLPKLDRPTSSNVSTPKVDHKLTPRGESGVISSGRNHKELKSVESDGKLGILSRSNSSIARRGSEIPSSSVRVTSVSGVSNASAEHKLNQFSPKEEPSSGLSWTTEKPSNSDNENLQDGLPHSWESSNQDEKTMEGSVTRLRPTENAGSKSVACQPGKEAGHAAETCTTLSSANDAPTARSVRQETNKGSKLKAAIEAAMLKKPGICRKRKENEQHDVLSSSNVDANCEIASQDKISGLNKTGEATHEGPAKLGTCQSVSFGQTDVNSPRQLNALSTGAVFPSKFSSDSIVPSSIKRSFQSASISAHARMLPIPEHEYIWQGGFEVHRAGKVSGLFGGIQAHLSTCASPKVLEVVNKFPQKITLDEVPRLSTWPRQFHDCGVREDNVALYFFAKDIESYAKHYKGLLDNMIQKDLAFKGMFGGVELFIFPSTQLPENSQRWNSLFFLWGVFKGRRPLESRPNDSDSLMKSVGRDVPSAIMPASEKSLLPVCSDKKATSCSSSSDVPYVFNAPNKSYISSSIGSDNASYALKMNPQTEASRFDSKSLPKIATKSMVLHPEIRCSSRSLVNVPENDLILCLSS